MRWAEDKTNECSWECHNKHHLASCHNNIDHPGFESREEPYPSIVSIMLPNFHSILLEIILDVPVIFNAKGLFFLILKTFANGFLIGREFFLDVHSQEQSKWVLVLFEEPIANSIFVQGWLLEILQLLEVWKWSTSLCLSLKEFTKFTNFSHFFFRQCSTLAFLELRHLNKLVNMLQHDFKFAVLDFPGKVVTNLENIMWYSSIAR